MEPGDCRAGLQEALLCRALRPYWIQEAFLCRARRPAVTRRSSAMEQEGPL